MGQITKLGDLIDRLNELDRESTIYASEPWSENSNALVANEPEVGGLPPEASDAGMKYFLEVSIAREFVEDWLASLDQYPDPSTVRQRIIDYAVNDA